MCAGALQVMLTSRLWWDDWATRVQWEQPKSRSKRCCLLLSRLSEGWYSAYMGVVTGGPEMDDAHRLATRLLNVGNGLFILLFLSAYTANLAAFLIRKDTGAFWTDIDAATAAGAKICVHTMLEPKVRLLYPDTNFHPRYMDVAADLQEGLEVRAHPPFAPGRQSYAVEAAPLRWRLQPYGGGCNCNPSAEAAALCGGGCSPVLRRLQPCVAEATALCGGGCSPAWRRL